MLLAENNTDFLSVGEPHRIPWRLEDGARKNQTAEVSDTYVLSFKYYREDLCEIDFLEKNRPKECIRVFKRITQTKVGCLQTNNIDRISIKDSGDYKKLFRRLTDGISLYEHKVQGTSRIFYFTSLNHFYVVAITNNHYETDKHR